MLSESTEKLFQGLAASGSRDKNMYRMSTLEMALLLNSAPLLCFAATKDFTAENIIFLVHIKEWREAWRTAPRAPLTNEITAAAQDNLFRVGTDFYTASVCEHTADLPLNLEGYVRDALQVAHYIGASIESQPLDSRLYGLLGGAAEIGIQSTCLRLGSGLLCRMFLSLLKSMFSHSPSSQGRMPQALKTSGIVSSNSVETCNEG